MTVRQCGTCLHSGKGVQSDTCRSCWPSDKFPNWVSQKAEVEDIQFDPQVVKRAAAQLAYAQTQALDLVNHPPHYTGHPSGVECIQIAEHMNFCRGNAIKYIWRAGEKGDPVQDLEKARWYIDREIARLKKPVDNA